eukprot:8525136-Karenia_brevis.AAC.1
MISTATRKVIFIFVSVEVAIFLKATNGLYKAIPMRAWQSRNLQYSLCKKQSYIHLLCISRWQEVGSLAAAAAAAV